MPSVVANFRKSGVALQVLVFCSQDHASSAFAVSIPAKTTKTAVTGQNEKTSTAVEDPAWKDEVARLLTGVIGNLEGATTSSKNKKPFSLLSQDEIMHELTKSAEQELDSIVDAVANLSEEDVTEEDYGFSNDEESDGDAATTTTSDAQDQLQEDASTSEDAQEDDEEQLQMEEDDGDEDSTAFLSLTGSDQEQDENENENEEENLLSMEDTLSFISDKEEDGEQDGKKYIPESTKKEVAKILNGIIGRLSKPH
ncbi:unnamed protein product [Amoebophrya sp. A120]|nr:unnamed protein product [Amoebophrya sp. A120]|eukprot:GSA120T00009261001.1